MPLAGQLSKQFYKPVAEGKSKGYFSVFATLILLIVLVALIYPAIKHITTINKEISDARVVKASLEQKLEDIETAKTNLADMKDSLPTLDLALPVGSDLNPYLKKIEAFAKKHKVKIAAIQFSAVPLSKPTLEETLKTKELSYSITLEGNFTQFRKFLTDLEKYIRTSDVSSVTLAKKEKGEVRQTLGVTSYYLGVDITPTEKADENQSGGNQ